MLYAVELNNLNIFTFTQLRRLIPKTFYLIKFFDSHHDIWSTDIKSVPEQLVILLTRPFLLWNILDMISFIVVAKPQGDISIEYDRFTMSPSV